MLAVALCAGPFAAEIIAADAATAIQNYYYDPAGRLIVVVDPANGSATYNYDANGNIVSVVRSPLTTVVAAQVSPSSAAAGATVTIYGTAFGTTANTTVSFNGTAATVSAATSTSLTVKVPSGATSGQITVTAPGGSAKTSYNFTVLGAAPTVSSVPSGKLTQGSTITIGGSGFDTNPANDVVVINNMRAQITAATATALTVVVPVCVGVAQVQVKTANGVAASAASVTVLPSGQLAANLQATVAATIGTTSSLSFDGSGHAVMVTFSATQGQNILFTFPSADAAVQNSFFALYAPDTSSPINNLSAVGTYNLLQPSNGYGPYAIHASGVYTLWIQPPAAAGSATLNVAAVPAPVTASLSNGNAVAVTTTAPGQQMQATFNATGGNYISLNVVNPQNGFGSSGSANLFYITGPNGSIYSTQLYNVDNLSGFFTGGLQLAANGTGTYTVTLTPAYPQFGTIDYTLYNVPAPAAPTLTAGGSAITMTSTVPGQTFAPTFTGTAGQTISLDFQTLGSTFNSWPVMTITGPTGQIYNSSVTWGNWITNNEHFTGLLTLPANGAGTYTVAVTPQHMDVGQIQLQLYAVPAAATAALTVGGAANTLTTTVPGQLFAPTFTASVGQRLAFELNYVSGTLGQGRGDAIAINGPLGNLWTGSLPQNNNAAQSFSGLLTVPTGGAGTYTITDTPYGAETGAQSFQVLAVPTDATGTATVGGAAVTITAGSPGQRMILTFPGTTGQAISVLANNFTGTLNTGNYGSMILTDPSGNQVNYQNCCSGTVYSNTITLAATGTYTVTLTPSGSTTGAATFQVFNEAPKTATLTPGGGSVSVTTTAPNQTVNVTAPETSGHRVAILAQFDSGLISGGDQMWMLAPDGSTYLFNNGFGSTPFWSGVLPPVTNTSAEPLLTQTGNYALTLTPLNLSQGMVTFTAYDVPLDVAATVTAGSSHGFTLTTPGQSLRMTYAAAANSSATFTVTPTSVTPSSVCYDTLLLQPDGQTIVSYTETCGGPYSTGSITLPTAGNYLLTVEPLAPATGTFTVGVTSP